MAVHPGRESLQSLSKEGGGGVTEQRKIGFTPERDKLKEDASKYKAENSSISPMQCIYLLLLALPEVVQQEPAVFTIRMSRHVGRLFTF